MLTHSESAVLILLRFSRYLNHLRLKTHLLHLTYYAWGGLLLFLSRTTHLCMKMVDDTTSSSSKSFVVPGLHMFGDDNFSLLSDSTAEDSYAWEMKTNERFLLVGFIILNYSVIPELANLSSAVSESTITVATVEDWKYGTNVTDCNGNPSNSSCSLPTTVITKEEYKYHPISIFQETYLDIIIKYSGFWALGLIWWVYHCTLQCTVRYQNAPTLLVM